MSVSRISSLPRVFLELVLNFLDAYDVFSLWATGDIRLRSSLGAEGAVKTAKVNLLMSGRIAFPLEFFSSLRGLRTLHICYNDPSIVVYRYFSEKCDLSALPPTLVDLKFQCLNPLELFYNRSSLALTIEEIPKSRISNIYRPCSFYISKYRRIGADFSSIFLNLDQLFPSLKSLTLCSKKPALRRHFVEKTPTFPDYHSRVLKGTFRQYSTPLVYEAYDLEVKAMVEHDLSFSEAFIRSVPRQLDKLKLKFVWYWHYQTLSYLPETIRDLRLHAVVPAKGRAGLDEDATLISSSDLASFNTQLLGPYLLKVAPSEIDLSSYPKLPSSLVKLTVYGNITDRSDLMLLQRIPAGLEKFKHKSDLLLIRDDMVNLLPPELQSLVVKMGYHFDLARVPAILPRTLTSLRIETGRMDSHPGSIELKDISWPETLTKLEIPLHGHPELLLSSISNLRFLEYLCLYEVRNAATHVETGNLYSLSSLKTLILADCAFSLQDANWLPPNLTRFETLRYSGLEEHNPMISHTSLPSSLTALSFSCCESLDAIGRTMELLRHLPPEIVSLKIVMHSTVCPGQVHGSNVQKPGSDLKKQLSKLATFQLLTKNTPPTELFSLLPSSLTELDIRDQTLSRVVSLQHINCPNLKLLRLSCIDDDSFRYLPPGLTEISASLKQTSPPSLNPVELASLLPRSLTSLTLQKVEARQWGDEVVPHLPRALVKLRLGGLSFINTSDSTVQSMLPRQLNRAGWVN